VHLSNLQRLYIRFVFFFLSLLHVYRAFSHFKVHPTHVIP
jgi:hypothetical protein